jgi:hypothetical protein
MTIMTAEDLMKAVSKMPAQERVKFFTLAGEKSLATSLKQTSPPRRRLNTSKFQLPPSGGGCATASWRLMRKWA